MGYCLPKWMNSHFPLSNSKKLFKTFFLLFFLSFSFQFLFAQNNVIKGRVTSGDSALSNITVQVRGTATTTQTNASGEYTITAAPNARLYPG